MQDHFLVKNELIFQILSPQPYILHMGCKLLIQMVEQEITAAAMPLQILFPQLLFHDLYILPELPCRDQGSPLPQSDHLLHTIRGHNRNMVFPPDLMDHLLNVLVCRLRLFRIDHMDIVVFHNLQVFSFHLIGIIHQYHLAAPVSLIVAEHIHQHPNPQSLPPESPLLHRQFPLSSVAQEQEWREQEGKGYMLQLGKLLMKHVGIVRTEASLSIALEELDRLISEISSPAQHLLSALVVSQRLHLARCLVKAALERKESRGGHFRSDYPETLPNDKAYHSIITQESIKQVFTFTPSPVSL